MNKLSRRIEALSPRQRKLLEMKLKSKGRSINIKSVGVEKAIYSSIDPVEEKEYYPVSSAQKRLFILYQFEGAAIGYNIPKIRIIEGRPDKKRLEQAFNALIRRHETLRTSFDLLDGEMIQRVHKHIEFHINHLEPDREFNGHMHIQSKEDLDHIVETIVKRFIKPFNLSKAPLLRVGLIELSGSKHILITDTHHIISDGTSQGILAKELTDMYNREDLPELRTQYKDFSKWQNELFKKDIILKQEKYWLETLSGEIPVLHMPLDFPRPSVQSFTGDRIRFDAGKELSEGLNRLALESSLTLYMVLLAAYNVLLSKLSGQEEIIVGSPVAGRRHPDLENVIGMFVNTLALKNEPAGNKTLSEFLEDVKKNSLKAYENQDYQFEELVEKLDIKRDLSRNPLFDTMFILQNIELRGIEIPELAFIPYEYRWEIAKFDLTINVVERNDNIGFVFEYCTKLFKKETVERFAKYFRNILSSLVENPGKEISEIEIITEEEKEKILYDFNDTRAEYLLDKTIHELFEEQVEKTLDGVSAVGNRHDTLAVGKKEMMHITYGVLNEKANSLAHSLREKGVQPDTITGIMTERSIEMIISLLGILKAGGAYLPIDPDYPQERIDYMLKDSKTKNLLTSSAVQVKVKEESIEIIDISDGFSSSTLTLTSTCRVSSANLAYIIYTSGTTGRPKGVLVSHSGFVNLIYVHQKTFGENRDSRMSQVANPAFDAMAFEVWPCLLSGAALYIADNETRLNPGKMKSWLIQQGITISFQPTVMAEHLLDESWPQEGVALKSLRTAGDRLTRYPAHHYPFTLYNLYGPTEDTVWTTWTRVEVEPNPPNPLIFPSIGKPVGNHYIFIMGPNFETQPAGIPGELCIGGIGLARGYLNRPELTAEKFIEYRSYKSYRTYILYKTGDLARWLSDGNIDFIGRIDQQVKIRGFRIEPGEIEALLTAIDGIKEAVVIDRDTKAGEKYLCGYIVSEEEIDPKKIKEVLSQKLPVYMIPDYYMQLDHIPLTPSGKVNRNMLPEPEFIAPKIQVLPGNEIEEKLAAIWEEVLNIEKEALSMESNFFDIGGNSLRLIKVNAKIKEFFNKDIPVTTMFRLTTIRELAAFIQREEINLQLADEVLDKSLDVMDETMNLLRGYDE
jgi:amino acid adenylation domain-containing protein